MNGTGSNDSCKSSSQVTKSNRIVFCGGLNFVKQPVRSYGPFLFIYAWWGFHVYMFYKVTLGPRINDGSVSLFHPFVLPLYILHTFFSFLCIVAFIRCTFSAPGVVEIGYDELLTEKPHRSSCKKCQMVRPRRAHHCRYCNTCIRKFDHHCPWINNCVGEDNKWLFVLLCFYSTVQSFLSFLLSIFYFTSLSGIEASQGPELSATSSASRVWLAQYEWWIMLIDLPLTGAFAFNMFTMTFAQMHYVRSDTTRYQSQTDPYYHHKPQPSADCDSSFSKLFGTSNRFLWLISALRRHSVVPQLIYEYPAGKEPYIL